MLFQSREVGHACGGVTRRRVLGTGLGLLAGGLLPGWCQARANASAARTLAFEHLHTGETLSLTYFDAGAYDEIALAAINHVLRDFRTGEVFPIRRELLDQMCFVRAALDSQAPFQIISGFRSSATNAMLHRTTNGVAARSLHMDGMAVDVRLRDVKTRRLRDVAAGFRLGGVGYYPASDFVHLDIGRPRQW